MSDKKSIEKLFGDALSKGGSHPPKGTEDAIRKKLVEAGLLKDNKSKKRFFFWLWSVSALVILSVTLGYFLKDDHKKIAQTTAQPEQNNPPASTGREQQNSYNVQRDSLPPAGSEAQIAANGNRAPSNTNIKSNPGTIQDLNSNTKNDNKGTKPADNGQKLKSARANEKDATTAADNAKAGAEENRSPGAQSDKNEKQDAGAQKNQRSATTQSPDNKTAVEPGDSSIVTADNASRNVNHPNLDEQADSIVSQNTDTAKTDEKKINLPPDSLSKEKNKKRFSIDVFVTPQLSNFKYESGYASYKEQTIALDISETGKISFGAGIGVNIPLKSFFVEPGINYSSMKSDFSYSELQASVDTSGSHYNFEIALIHVLDSNGVIIDSSYVHTDSAWVTVSDTSFSKIPANASNKISVIEIPLWAGYKFNSGKFDFELKAGASVSFITSINTTILPANSEEVVLYDDLKNSPYRKNYFSLLAGASVIYNINDRFAIFLQPAFKYGLGSIFKSDYPVSKKITSYSLGAGLRINF